MDLEHGLLHLVSHRSNISLLVAAVAVLVAEAVAAVLADIEQALDIQ